MIGLRSSRYVFGVRLPLLTAAIGSEMLLGVSVGQANRAIAQVVPDGTLPMPSVVTPTGVGSLVNGGTRSGAYLFHSFREFSIPEGQTVEFMAAPDLAAIIARVTGPTASMLAGQLLSSGPGDFFLLNPQGISFGPNAQLNVGGSFIASTANSLLFDNGAEFSAVNPQAPPLLTVNVPIGLQLGANSAPIQALGTGHGLTIDPDTLQVLEPGSLVGLQVSVGKTLGLIGGDLNLAGASLMAPDGRVALASAPNTPNGLRIGLQRDELGWRLADDWLPTSAAGGSGGAIALTDASALVSRGSRGGAIQIQGRRLEVLGGSTLWASTYGDGNGLGVSLQTSEAIRLDGVVSDPVTGEALFPSSLLAEVGLTGTGRGNDVAIATPTLSVTDGAQVSLSSFGLGNGGNLAIAATQVTLSGGTPEFGASGLYLDVADPLAEGNGGQLRLMAAQLTLVEGGRISANSFGLGAAGLLQIQAQMIDLLGGAAGLGSSGLFAQAEGSGAGGGIQIQSDRLQIQSGALISSSTLGTGQGGPIQITTQSLDLTGTSPGGRASGIFSLVGPDASGSGGDIRIQANQLSLAAGAELNSSTLGSGDAGNLILQANRIDLQGDPSLSTGIFATVEEGATGAGGQLTLTADQLRVQNGAQIAVGTKGSGNAGNLQVQAQEVTLSGGNAFGRSGLFANALIDQGQGGDIELTAQSVTLDAGATINASNFSSQDPTIPPGQGAAGNIRIQTPRLTLRNDASITASTAVGDRGNITIDSEVIVLRDRSRITTNASADATGGNIAIQSQFIVAPSTENSDITANALRGQGGNITIQTQGLLGIAYRNQLTEASDITASSEFGLAGTVVLNQPEVDPSRGLAELPSLMAEGSDRLVAGCPADQGARFVLSGRGGLPANPSQVLEEELVRQPLPPLPLSPANTPTHAPTHAQANAPTNTQAALPGLSPRSTVPPPESPQAEWSAARPTQKSKLQEATGWVIQADGRVQLLAAPSAVPGAIGTAAPACDRRANPAAA